MIYNLQKYKKYFFDNINIFNIFFDKSDFIPYACLRFMYFCRHFNFYRLEAMTTIQRFHTNMLLATGAGMLVGMEMGKNERQRVI